MFHKSKRLISAIIALVLLTGCGVDLPNQISDKTLNDNSISLKTPENWVYSSDGDIMIYSETEEKLQNDDWCMMLSANLISTVGEKANVTDIAQKIIMDDFQQHLVHGEKLSSDCYWVKIETAELSYFIVTDQKTGIYIYGRTFNERVDEETSKAIAKSINIGA